MLGHLTIYAGFWEAEEFPKLLAVLHGWHTALTVAGLPLFACYGHRRDARKVDHGASLAATRVCTNAGTSS